MIGLLLKYKRWFTGGSLLGMNAAGFLLSVELGGDKFKNFPAVLKEIANLVEPFWFYIWLGSITVWVAAKLLLREKANWQLVEFFLERAYSRAYQESVNSCALRRNHNQVTLFKYKKFIWPWNVPKDTTVKWYKPYGNKQPWGGWVVPIKRANGDGLNVRSATFYCPLDDEELVEGVAGNALLFLGESLRTPPEGGLKAVTSASPDSSKMEYALTTFTSLERVNSMLGKQSGRMLPLSMGAIPIFVNGRIWGSLVFDSRSRDGVPTQLHEVFSTTVNGIQRALGGEL